MNRESVETLYVPVLLLLGLIAVVLNGCAEKAVLIQSVKVRDLDVIAWDKRTSDFQICIQPDPIEANFILDKQMVALQRVDRLKVGQHLNRFN